MIIGTVGLLLTAPLGFTTLRAPTGALSVSHRVPRARSAVAVVPGASAVNILGATTIASTFVALQSSQKRKKAEEEAAELQSRISSLESDMKSAESAREAAVQRATEASNALSEAEDSLEQEQDRRRRERKTLTEEKERAVSAERKLKSELSSAQKTEDGERAKLEKAVSDLEASLAESVAKLEEAEASANSKAVTKAVETSKAAEARAQKLDAELKTLKSKVNDEGDKRAAGDAERQKAADEKIGTLETERDAAREATTEARSELDSVSKLLGKRAKAAEALARQQEAAWASYNSLERAKAAELARKFRARGELESSVTRLDELRARSATVAEELAAAQAEEEASAGKKEAGWAWWAKNQRKNAIAGAKDTARTVKKQIAELEERMPSVQEAAEKEKGEYSKARGEADTELFMLARDIEANCGVPLAEVGRTMGEAKALDEVSREVTTLLRNKKYSK